MHMFRVGHNGLGGCLEASIYNDFCSLNKVCISSLLEAVMGNGRNYKKRSNIIRLGHAQWIVECDKNAKKQWIWRVRGKARRLSINDLVFHIVQPLKTLIKEREVKKVITSIV